MNVAIIGYGKQGKSSADYWFNKGNTVTICDQNPDLELPPNVNSKLGVGYLNNLHEFDLLVRSPAVHPKTILDANPEHPEIIDKITSNTEEFMKVCNAPVIGVTGTKGKGTTSTLIAKILQLASFKVYLGGNIGTPPLDLLKNSISPSDIVVLELANFQLIDLKLSPHIAVCLMISEDHLNWHADMYEYTNAKKQIFTHQQHDDIAIYNANNLYATELITASPAQTKISFDVPDIGAQPEFTDGFYVDGANIKFAGKTIISVKDVKLLGRHNLQNVCAAIAATWDLINHKGKIIKKAVQDFTGLPNRLELVDIKNKITYYNDSFASAPGALIAGLDAITVPKVMIVGGYDRMLNLDDLTSSLLAHKDSIRKVLLIGESAQRVAENCSNHGFTNFVVSTGANMQIIVQEATSLAQPGDAVMLSPGFASFDMFKDFEDRGNQFREGVRAL